MKPLIVNAKNAPRIQAILDDVQKLAREHTVTLDQVLDSIKELEYKLSNVLNKKDWDGLTFDVNLNAQSFPNAYRYTPHSTNYTLTRKGKNWMISRICRSFCNVVKFYQLFIVEIDGEQFHNHPECEILKDDLARKMLDFKLKNNKSIL